MREKIVAIIFMLIIIVIPIKTFVNVHQVKAQEESNTKEEIEENVVDNHVETESKENETESETTEITEKTVSKEKDDNSMDSIRGGVDDILDNIALKEQMAEVNSKLTEGMSGGKYIESNQVILGKDDWLFFKDESDGTPLSDYEGTNWYSEADLITITNNLINQRDVFREKGIRFVVMIPPNKEMIYADKMPPTIFRKNTVTKADKLVEYLRANSDLEIIYPKEEIMLATNTVQTYFKYDTHWNDVGAFVGAQSIMKHLYGVSELLEGKVVTGVTDLTGDLAMLVKMEDIYNDDIEYKINSFDTSLNHGENLLVVGDSFRERLVPNLSPYFNQVTDMLFNEFTMAQLDTIQPNVVIWECVERHTNRLKSESIVNQ